MEKRKKTGGRDWKPGQSGNLDGRPATPKDVKDGRIANRVQLERILAKFLGLGREELKAIMGNPETPAMELLVASILVKAITNGDYTRAAFLFDRAFGKVADVQEFGGSVHAALVAAMSRLGKGGEGSG